MKITTLAQLGCGYWGPNLVRNFSRLHNARLKWVVDTDPARRSYIEENFPKVQTSDDWKSILEDPEVEAVIIATAASTHFQFVKAALLAKKHVFVEKPLATSTLEADELVALAAHADRTLMVGHTFLYNPAVRYLKGILTRGDLGSLYYIYSHRLNLGQVRSDVNVWWNLAPHDVSILLYLMDGELPVSVSAHGADYIQDRIEDVAFVTLTWADKLIANIQVSWLDPAKVRRMTLVGTKKMVIYDDVLDQKITILDKGVDRVPIAGEKMDYDESGFKIQHRKGDVWQPQIPSEEPLHVEAKHFVECVQNKRTPLTGPAHARDVVAILEAGDQALKSGKRVPVRPRAATPHVFQVPTRIRTVA